MEILHNLNEAINIFLQNAGLAAPFLSCLLIMLEGTFAFLPLFIFVTVNMLTMGNILGILVSFCCTIIGNFLAFFLCRIGLNPLFQKFIKDKSKINKFMDLIDNISFSKLILIISIPLTPSFLVNLSAGLSKIPKKKYLYALLLGKPCVLLFWGFIGTSLIECLTNPVMFIKVVLMIIICNLIGNFVNKKFNLDNL